MTRRIFTGTVCAARVGAEPRTGEVREAEEELLAGINREREREGLTGLRWSERVARVARVHSEEMARARYFGHEDLNSRRVSERLRGAGVRHRACGENLYWQPGGSGLAGRALGGWLRSEEHRANLLRGEYREAGVGIAVDERGRWVVTVVFVG